jgi:MFS transporter, ACS family, tartrate transporter
VILGVLVFIWLPNRPVDATWLNPAQRAWLIRTLEEQEARYSAAAHPSLWRAIGNAKATSC